jgi:hypothetical protein
MIKIFPVLLVPSFEVFLDLPEEPPSTQEQPWRDLESFQNRRKNRPDEAQENPEFRFYNAHHAVRGTQTRSDRLAGAEEKIIPGHPRWRKGCEIPWATPSGLQVG